MVQPASLRHARSAARAATGRSACGAGLRLDGAVLGLEPAPEASTRPDRAGAWVREAVRSPDIDVPRVERRVNRCTTCRQRPSTTTSSPDRPPRDAPRGPVKSTSAPARHRVAADHTAAVGSGLDRGGRSSGSDALVHRPRISRSIRRFTDSAANAFISCLARGPAQAPPSPRPEQIASSASLRSPRSPSNTGRHI